MAGEPPSIPPVMTIAMMLVSIVMDVVSCLNCSGLAGTSAPMFLKGPVVAK